MERSVVSNKPKMTRPSVYQFKLGDFTITNILEGYRHLDNLYPFAGTNADAAEVEAMVEPAAGSDGIAFRDSQPRRRLARV